MTGALSAQTAPPAAPVQLAALDPADPAAAPPPEAPPTVDTSLGEIVVTATRSAQSIQRVPISIQALGMEKMADRQVKGFSDIASLLPSVSFAGIGPGRNNIYFRGIVPAGGSYAATGYYLDDIPITSAGNSAGFPDIHVYDMERVEALSGPQGTLYGAGSLAGTIRFITNKPKVGEFQFGYNLEGNKYGKGDFGGQAEAYVNLPAGETLTFRATGFYRRDGGYIDNKPNNGKFNNGASSTLALGDNNPATFFTLDNSSIAKNDYNPITEYGGRVTALWTVMDDWDVTPSIMAQRQISRGYFGYDERVGDLQVHDFDETRQDDKWYQASLAIHGHIGDFDLVSATGYFQRKTKLNNDYTYYTVTYDGFGAGYENYLQFFDKSGCTGSGATLKCTKFLNPQQYYHALTFRDKFTQELRLTTPKTWPFELTVGGFYQYQKQRNNTYYAIRGLDQIVGYTQAGGGDRPGGLIGVPTSVPNGTMVLGTPAVKEDGFYIVETNQYFKDSAIFAEGHYDITPTLKLTGGIRYFWTKYRTLGFSGVMGSAANQVTSLFVPTGAKGCPTPLPAARLQCLNSNFAAADQTGRYKEDGETHKVALNWQFTPSKMLYANYSTGFRPGGFNRPLRIRNLGVVTVPPFKSETLTNYEIGFKTTWDNILRFNMAIYQEDWDNIQYSVVVSGAQGAGMTGNAGKARVRGVEYDADLKLGRITLSSAGAYNDGKLRGNFCNFAVNAATLAITQLPTCTLGQNVPGSTPPTAQVAAADGTRLPRQPRFKGTSSIRYDMELGEYAAYLQGAALYQSSATQELNVSQNALLICGTTPRAGANCGTTPGFVSFDFSGGIKKDNWTIDLFIQNAFDKRGTLTKNTFCSISFCSDSARTFINKPQFMGVRFGQKF